MEKNLNLVVSGVELLVALGVSTLVGGAIVMVKPAELGAIKKIAVGFGGMAISYMAADAVKNYVDKEIKETVQQVKDAFRKKIVKEETIEGEEA